MNKFCCLLASTYLTTATEVFNPTETSTYDLEDAAVAADIEESGLVFTSYSAFTLKVKDIPTTGYIWHT